MAIWAISKTRQVVFEISRSCVKEYKIKRMTVTEDGKTLVYIEDRIDPLHQEKLKDAEVVYPELLI